MENLETERIQTAISGADHNDDIFITEKAITEIRTIRTNNNVPVNMFLRLGTRGGGCSGMNYIIGFDSQMQDNDRAYKIRDFEIVIDSKSLFYLMGVTLDFDNNESGSGFVFNNSFNESVCGCSH